MALAPEITIQSLSDTQIFEYSDTLSFLIPDGQRHLKAGQPVVISKKGGVAGILVTDIRPETEPAMAYGMVPSKPTYGHNGVHHASVRVNGGVFHVQGTSASGAAAGDPVYLKATTGNSGEPTVTLAASGADVILGYLYKAPASGSGKQDLQVVIRPGVVSA